MEVAAGTTADRGPVVSSAVVAIALGVLVFTVFTGFALQETTPVVALVVTMAVSYRSLLLWKSLVALLVLVILFVPMRRYELPGNLPFKLEPYRVLVAVILIGWLISLLIDPRVRVRRSGFERPLALIAVAVLGSVVVNGHRMQALGIGADVGKELTFLASFVFVFYLVVSVVRTREQVDFLLKVLVAGGAVVGGFTVVESRTGFNVFNHLSGVIPLLRLGTLPYVGEDRLRAYGSAQHPIAMGAALVMLVPVAVYLVRSTGRRHWWLATALLGFGALATVSRTSVLMFSVAVFVLFMLRPREAKRMWPALVVGLLVVHFALPGTLGTLKNSFFPKGGLIAQQKSEAGMRGSNRLADLGPGLQEWKREPLLGQGFATRLADSRAQDIPILDDQWLGTLLETGIVGVAAWAWLFLRSIRGLARAARSDPSDGWLPAALGASIAAYAVGMFVYDAFAFIQVSFLLFILLAFAAVLRQAEIRNESAQGDPLG